MLSVLLAIAFCACWRLWVALADAMKVNAHQARLLALEAAARAQKFQDEFQAQQAQFKADMAWLDTLPESQRGEAARALLIERGLLPPPEPPQPSELPGLYL